MFKICDNVDLSYFKKIEGKISGGVSVTEEEIDYFLSYVVYVTRSKIFDGDFYFENKCDLAQSMICYYFDDIGVMYHPNMTHSSITDLIIGHNFTVAEFNVMGVMVNYLIDPTYIQFFRPDRCSSQRYIEFNDCIIRTPYPGYYILDCDKDIINDFNYCGYGKLTDKLAEIYGNSFYNTKTMVFDKEYKSMDGFVYVNSFLKGKEKLSKSRDELIEMGVYLSFNSGDKKRL